jgi:TetR/AcrR family transcriptional regulator
MDPLHPLHLFILLWSVTQFYADFGVMVENMLDTRRVSRTHYEAAAETIIHIVLKGCGVGGGVAPPRGAAAASRLRAGARAVP